jgi:HSP20 family protein
MPRARWWWGDSDARMVEWLRAQQQIAQVRDQRVAGVYPAVNIYDDGDKFMIRAEVPGVDKTKLEITCKRNEVTIQGERNFRMAEEGSAFHRRERDQGVFHRIVTLPDEVDGGRLSASYRNGVLEVVCPRPEASKPRKIEIS